MPSIIDRINTGPVSSPESKDEGKIDKPSVPPVVKLPITSNSATGTMYDLKNRVQLKLLSELDDQADLNKPDKIKKRISALFDQILQTEKLALNNQERTRLFDQIIAEILGYGPLDALLQDASITEIMVNGSDELYIEREGKLIHLPNLFENDAHLMRIIEKIVAPLGRRIDETSPYVDARLPDGSRVNAVIPPISLIGPVLTIRKFAKTPITVEKLIELGTVTNEVMYFLKACVESRINILISGGTGSGKTTFLNVLSGFIHDDERIITIENAAELQLRQEHTITLESRPVNIEGKGEVTVRELVVNALRMRPDRIIVGEIRDGAAFDMLQAMNTGHEGSMSTLHSNSPKDALSRLETMVLMAGMDLPTRAIRDQISSAVDVIIHVDRMRDGTRKVTSIAEILGIVDGEIVIKDIFKFDYQGYQNNRLIGTIKATGYHPKFLQKLELAGITIPGKIFDENIISSNKD